ncbi:MAG: hypothetical protein K1X94_23340 [Sandaracinaceae bacterium]|nr:hypothetical protein [Sandaracinaceae bacterium]
MPHRDGVVRPRSLAAAVLVLGIAACDGPIGAGDAGGVDALVVGAGPDAAALDAASLDAPMADDAARAEDAPRLDTAADAGPDRSLVAGVHEVLFVGNSYTYVGDVPARYRGLLGATAPRIESVAFGGYTLAQHATDAATDGTALAGWLRTGTMEQRAFDAVVLQEQSQIGGFPEDQPDRMASLAGASALATLAHGNGSAVVLYLTWGREHGDDLNPGLFPTYEAMQDRLDAGYRAMAVRLRGEGNRVRVAPVGAAFRAVHDDVVALGMDPEAEGSAFDALYASDGSHPSEGGAYLAAVVIEATISGADPTSLPDATDLDPSISRAYREVAARVMADPAWESELR